jgi:hypothetical protein
MEALRVIALSELRDLNLRVTQPAEVLLLHQILAKRQEVMARNCKAARPGVGGNGVENL